MSQWPSTKARLVLSALLRIGWTTKRQSGTSHRILSRPGWPDFTFAFHGQEEIGPRMLARIAKRTVLIIKDLQDAVQLVPAVPLSRRHFGSAKGLIVMAENFDAPLPDFNEYMP